MKIIWLSEMTYGKKIPADHPNLKSDVAFLPAVDADHYSLHITKPLDEDVFKEYDFVMINNTPGFYKHSYIIDNLDMIQKHCKVGLFQEGPINDWQDWALHGQAKLLKTLKRVDAYFCSNIKDIPYYKALVWDKIPVYWLKSPLNLSAVQKNIKPLEEKNGLIIGGTFCKWYNGATSMEIANAIKTPVLVPSMGRMKENEHSYFSYYSKNKTYLLPFSNFMKWIEDLSHLKYAVHMMPSVAAGSFHTNCAALGIPCIGNEEVDTQRMMFPDLSIHAYRDIKKGKELLKRLEKDEAFYDEVVTKALNKVKDWDINVVGKELKDNIKEIMKNEK